MVIMNMAKIIKTPDEWKEQLTPEQYEICINHGTEPPFSGKYAHRSPDGTYECTCCGNELFSSDAKFDSGTGWPSFSKPKNSDSVEYVSDRSYGMLRIEVNCAKCGAHLGHVFDDGPRPAGQRYCINSISLEHQGADE